MVRNVSKQCRQMPWCDQGTREHIRHEVTLGTWSGWSQTGPRRPMYLQLVIHGLEDADAAPMLAIVDSATDEQTDITLGWPALMKMTSQADAAWVRFRRGR